MKNKIVSVRFTEDELKLVEEKSVKSGLTRGEYIHRCALGRKTNVSFNDGLVESLLALGVELKRLMSLDVLEEKEEIIALIKAIKIQIIKVR